VVARPGSSTSALTGPGDFTIHDVAADGRWLVTRDDIPQGVGVHLAADKADRDLSWLNQNWGVSLSADGSKLLFSDGTAGGNYGVVWRKTDGSPIVQLGEGNANGFSPDGQWALAQIFTPPDWVAYPMGAGEPIHFKRGSLDVVHDMEWFPDGKSLLVTGREKGKPVRGYRQQVPDGLPVPLLPEGVFPGAVTRDGEYALGHTGKGGWQWYPIAGGAPRAIPDLHIRLGAAVGWSADGRSPLLQPGDDVPVTIDKLDFATGKVTPFKTIAPTDATGLLSVTIRSMSADGQQYAFSYVKRVSTLFVVSQQK